MSLIPSFTPPSATNPKWKKHVEPPADGRRQTRLRSQQVEDRQTVCFSCRSVDQWHPTNPECPNLDNLHTLSAIKPFGAVIRLVDKFVVPRGLWDKFLGVLDDVGLENVREEFFDRALKGKV